METKIKQNKNSSVVFRRLFSFLTAFVVLVFSISFSSFAYTDTSTNGIDFTDQPLPFADQSLSWEATYNLGVPVYTRETTPVSTSYNASVRSDSDNSVYVFAAPADNGGSLTYFFIDVDYQSGESHPNIYLASHYGSSYGGSSVSSAWINSSYHSGWYYQSVNGSDSLDSVYVPLFSSRDSGLAALEDWIDNPGGGGGSSGPSPVSFTLQPGYVAFVDVSNLSNVSVSLGTSVFGGAEWSPRVTDQAIGVVSSRPNSFSIPISGTSPISWSGTGSKNVLGQYKNFSYSYTVTSVGGTSYLCIVNPLQRSQGAQLTASASMPSARMNPISVSVSSAMGVKVYSLTSSLAVGSGTLDTETDGDTWSGSPDENGQWAYTNDQTGDPTDIDALPVGGGNDPIIGTTSINDWLQEIANQISGFFSGAIGAVSTLVGAGSDFIHSLSGLYAWLPGPVYSVLCAALILVITIGVIKVFI